MTVSELTRDQLVELKQRYLCDTMGNVSWSDLADADTLVPDDTIFDAYKATDFVPDDFGHPEWPVN